MGVFLLIVVFGITFQTANAWGGGGAPLTYSVFKTGMNYPGQIAVDGSGNVYVSGYTGGGDGVAKYDSGGSFITSFGPGGTLGVDIDPDGNLVVLDSQGASLGVSPGVKKYTNGGTPIDISSTDMGGNLFVYPYGVAIDSSGNVYIADYGITTIFKFNSSYTQLTPISGNGGAFSNPESVAVDGSDNVYVLDSGNNRVQKFDSSGNFIMTVTGNGGAWNYPEAFAVDSIGNIIVADSGNNRIQFFNASGTYQQEITSADINSNVPTYSYFNGMGFQNPGTLFIGDNTRVLKLTFDAVDPSVSITALPGNTTTDTTPTFNGTATDATSTLTAVEYSVDSDPYAACIADDGAFDELSETYSCSVASALSIGSHTIHVRATDSKTNTNSGGTLANYTFTVSTTPTAILTTSDPILPPSTTTADLATPPVSCTTTAPTSAPDLYEVSRAGTSVTLNFTPVNANSTGYYVSYGYLENQEVFSAIRNINYSNTGISYTINSLDPLTQYYFRVRAMNDCVPGPWSNSKFVSGNIASSSSDITPTPTGTDSVTPSPWQDEEVPVVTTVPSAIETSGSTSGSVFVIVDINGNPISGVGITTEETNAPTSTQVNTTGPSEIITEVAVDTTSIITGANLIEQISNLSSYIFGVITNESGQLSLNLADGNYTITIWTGVTSFTFPSIEVKNNQTIYLRLPIDKATLLAANPLPGMINRAEQISAVGVKATGISLLAYSAFGLTTSGFVVMKTLLSLYLEMGKNLASLPFQIFKGMGKWGKRFASNALTLFAGDMFIQPRTDGVVFDSTNHRPISGAYVVLYSPSGNLATDFTDMAGRYFVKPEPDNYRIKVDALSYMFPSKIITVAEDSIYSNVYTPGLELRVTEPERKVARMSLPMDPRVHSKINNTIRSLESFLLKMSPLFYAFAFTVLFLAGASEAGGLYRGVLVALIIHLALKIYSFLHKVMPINR